tara:strand:+ start:860 stop:1141 length:282 start_codon:yes stop_codon:yes gene_type:complete
MTEKAKNHFLALGMIIRCPFGRPELGRVCSMAWNDKGGRLLCAAMQGWTESLEVEGLDRCFWTAKNEYKLKIANKRNKGLKSAQQIQKTSGDK